jgi:hypothetical protein
MIVDMHSLLSVQEQQPYCIGVLLTVVARLVSPRVCFCTFVFVWSVMGWVTLLACQKVKHCLSSIDVTGHCHITCVELGEGPSDI